MKQYRYILRILFRFFQLRSAERLAFGEAFFLFIIVRLWILLFPFKWIAPTLGIGRTKSPGMPIDHLEANALLVEQSLRRAQQSLPRVCTCLVQSIAGKFMLRRRLMSNTLHLGVAKDTSHGLIAHAWLCCGDRVIAGAQEMMNYTEVATFSDNFKL
jgi:hypothetical protein